MATVHTFQVEDSASSDGAAAYCSGLNATITARYDRRMAVGGTPGSGNRRALDLSAPSTDEVFYFVEADRISNTLWPQGQWRIEINVSSANANFTVHSVFICRLNSSGVNQGTVGSTSGFTYSLGNAGSHTFVVDQPGDVNAANDDRVGIVIGGDISGTGSQQVFFTTDTQVVSPIPLDVEATPDAVDVTVDHPAATYAKELEATPAAVDVTVDHPTSLGGLVVTPAVVDVTVDHPVASTALALEVTPAAVDVDVDHPAASYSISGLEQPGAAGQILTGQLAAGQVVPAQPGVGQIIAGANKAGQIVPAQAGVGQILTGRFAAGQILGGAG